MRLEQRIVIGTEMSRRPALNAALNMQQRSAPLTGPGARRADEATRELVHDHEHPVAPEHDGLASEEVNAPQALFGVSD